MTAARCTAISIMALAGVLFAIGGVAESRSAAARHALDGQARIALQAAEILSVDPLLRRQAIVVEARGETLVLLGSAESPEARDAAIEAIRRIPGVRQVRSEIRVLGESLAARQP